MNCITCFDVINTDDIKDWENVLSELGSWAGNYRAIKKTYHKDCYANEFYEHKGFKVFWELGE